MSWGRRTGGALLAVAVALVAAAPASAFRSPEGARPTVRILTKDQPAAAKARTISLRVTVGTRARVRLRVLALDIGPRPVAAVTERKVRFSRASGKIVRLRLSKAALRGIKAATAACRNLRFSAFASGRRLRRQSDDPRTTLVRHSRTLKHRRKSGCGPASGVPGVPGTPGATPGPGGPGLDAPGTPRPNAPPVPNDPIAIRAGAADVDATPPVGTPMFAYTARSQIFGPDPNHILQVIADPDENLYAKTFVPSQGIHTRLRARAIVIEAGGKKYALAMIDLGGHPYTFNQAVAEKIAATGIPHERLFLSSTHTHSSAGAIWSADNSGYAFVGGDAYDPRVFEIISSAVADAIVQADKRLQPARIGVGTATLRGASSNREQDAIKRNPDSTPAEKASSSESVDHRVTAIRVDDAKGAPLGVWSNFAIHPTSFGDDNLLFSGDNAATTERLVEDEMLRDAVAAGRVPSVRPVNVWTNGTEGDVTDDPSPPLDPTVDPQKDPHAALELVRGGFGESNSSGRKVSAGVLAAWRDAGTKMSGSPALDVRRTFMSMDGSDGTAQIPVLGAGGIVAEEGPDPVPVGGCAPPPGNPVPGQAEKQTLFGGPGIAPDTFPVSMLRIGPLAVAAYPTEISTVAGRRIKSAIAGAVGAEAPAGVTIVGLTNAYNSYLATPEEYEYCSYFGSFTLWGKQQSVLYRSVGVELAKSLYGGQALPARGSEPAAVSPGTPNQPSVRPTENAGTPVTQPAKTVKRLGQAAFKWNGGDPAIDAPRNKAFVTLEYDNGSGFKAVGTEDSVLDATQHAADDSWTDTWQFTECDALGRYRFHVRGRANKGDGEADYETISDPFTLAPATIKSYSAVVEGGVAKVRAEYDLPASPLGALARRVRHGFAVIRFDPPNGPLQETIALPDSRGLEFRAGVPAGSTIDAVVSIEDACGNTGR